VNGNPRGLNHPLSDGRILRPTLALLDDVQDRTVATSPQQVIDTIEIIDGDVAGMGEAGTNIPMLMSGNCIALGDVMAHYLESEQWESLRVSCVESWPDGWKDGAGPTAKLWEEWAELQKQGKGGAFYRANKKQMTRGFVLSSPSTFKASKANPDAFCGAMESYYKMGAEAFASEKQQRPTKRGVTMYNLTHQLVQSRVTDRPAGEVPDWAQVVVAATDINRSYALSSVVVAFGANQVAAVLWYGLHPMSVREDMTEIEKRRLIYEGLSTHGKELAALPCRPALWAIDGGGSPEGCVIQLAYNAPQICGLQAACTFGRGWKMFRPVTKATYKVRAGEMWQHVSERKDRQWIIYQADYWREVAQKGWIASPGSPGSCSLPQGRHEDFAIQVTREQLSGKEEVGGRMVWVWTTAPGPHDFGDCMQMAYMAASFRGIGSIERTDPKPKAKAYIPMMRPSSRR
jgi:hypothetical protein